jgi:FkbM family methyltransferase
MKSDNNIKHLKSKLLTRDNSDDSLIIKELLLDDMYKFTSLCQFEKYKPITCIDAGAHIGVFTSMFLELFEQSNVISFEPNSSNFEILKSNCEIYGNRSKIYNKAIGLKDGKMELYQESITKNTGTWSLTPNYIPDSNKTEVVEVINICEFLEMLNFTAVDVMLKLDLEGYESEIIDGIPFETMKKIRWLLLEEHHLPIDHQKILDAGFILLFNPYASNRHFVYLNLQGANYPLGLLLQFVNSSISEIWKSKYDTLYANSRLTPKRLFNAILSKIKK